MAAVKPILKNGKIIAYGWITDGPMDPATGKRKQVRRRFPTSREAKAALADYESQRNKGTLVRSGKRTVADVLDELVPFLTTGKQPATVVNFTCAVRPVRERLGAVEIQKLTEAHVVAMVEWMVTSGRKIGGKKGTGVGARSVTLTLMRLRQLLDEAVDRQWTTRNVAKRVQVPTDVPADEARAIRTPWTAAEVQTFLTALTEHRAYAVVLLSMLGMRPAEVCGLTWSNVDLDAGTVAIATTRTEVYGRGTVVKTPKSRAGVRVRSPCPMPHGPVCEC